MHRLQDRVQELLCLVADATAKQAQKGVQEGLQERYLVATALEMPRDSMKQMALVVW